jgi:hypothetical protein
LTPSLKSQRTKNPIREIVDPIVASTRHIQQQQSLGGEDSGSDSDDQKELISLAVRRKEKDRSSIVVGLLSVSIPCTSKPLTQTDSFFLSIFAVG